MITLFPLTFWTEKPISGRSGSSWFFVCSAQRTHPYAAAIMAQEVYETRYKTVRALGISAVAIAGVAGGSFALGLVPTLLDAAAVGVFSLAGGMLGAGLYPEWQRELELRGQMIECVVRQGFYGERMIVALTEAAEQLTGYDQFRGWSHSRLAEELLARHDFAKKWVIANHAMIQRAFKETSK